MLTQHVLRLLQSDALRCAVVNKYAEPEASSCLRALGCREVRGIPLTCYLPPLTENFEDVPSRVPASRQTKEGLLYHYSLNVSSVLPVLALQLQPRDSVFDMCAAPGGKTFAILQQVCLESGLAVNEPFLSRLSRLRSVVRGCLPAHLRQSVRFTRRRGEEWAEIERDEYDKVLVDAPCSSDRYCAGKWLEKGQYYPESARLSALQVKLLVAGLVALKRGGDLVYSTCTLAEGENDGVVRKVRAMAGEGLAPEFDCVEVDGWGELEAVCNLQKTKLGVLVTPEEGKNSGPTYIAKCHKL